MVGQNYPSWVQMVWWPTAQNPDRTTYWVVSETATSLRRVVPAGRPGIDVYYINGERVYRDHGHADGPSSVPYLRLHLGWVRADEGYPTGASGLVLYRVLRIPKPSKGLRVRKLRRDDP